MTTDPNKKHGTDTGYPPPGGPQGNDKDPEEDKPGAPGSDLTTEQKGKKVDADPETETGKPVKE